MIRIKYIDADEPDEVEPAFLRDVDHVPHAGDKLRIYQEKGETPAVVTGTIVSVEWVFDLPTFDEYVLVTVRFDK